MHWPPTCEKKKIVENVVDYKKEAKLPLLLQRHKLIRDKYGI